MAPTAVEHIVLSVVVAEDELVDGLCAVDDFVDERFAKSILVGAFGLVADGHADAAHLAFVHIVAAEEEVELVVSLDDGGSPERSAKPRDVGLCDDILVLRPVHEVFAREGVEVQLLVVGSAKRREDPVLSVEDSAFGVGIPTGEDGVAAGLFLLGISSRCDAAQGQDNDEVFHRTEGFDGFYSMMPAFSRMGMTRLACIRLSLSFSA